METLQTYCMISVAIGIFQILDGIILLKQKGKYVKFNIIFAFFQLIWLGICFMVFSAFDNYNIQPVSPIAYVVYSAVDWIYGAKVLRGIKDPMNIILPRAYIIFGILFGVFYATLNIKQFLVKFL